MIAAILAVIGAALSVVGGIVNSGAAKYAQRNAEYQASIDFQRQKEATLFGIYSQQQQTKMIIIALGIIGLIALVYFMNKSN